MEYGGILSKDYQNQCLQKSGQITKFLKSVFFFFAMTTATSMFNYMPDWASPELSPSVESCGCGLGPSPVRLG